MRNSKRFISLLILVVIGLHALPVVFYRGRWQSSWPFLAWSMFAASRPAGPIEARTSRLFGVTSRGEKELVTAAEIGLLEGAVTVLYISPLRAGDSGAARRLVDRLNRRRRDPFVEIHLETTSYRVTDAGVVGRKGPTLVYPVHPRE